ncbi:hypothetical protein FO519_004733 [Halicephalobus sp. NKZ332]|nr:hypothetical protein FO519_004733 [Halicephalobus sp. NKZ332]
MKNLNFDFWIDVAGEVWKNSEDEEKLKKFLLSGKEAFSGFQQLSKTVVELRDWELIFNDESGIIVQYGFLPKTVFPIFAGKLKALSMENKIFTENKEFREILEKNNTFFTDAIEVSFEDEWSFNDHVSLIKKLCPDFHVEAMTLGGISIANFKKSIDAPNKVLNYEFKFVNCYAEES